VILEPPLFMCQAPQMKKSHSKEIKQKIPGARIAILQARWHCEHTDRMVSACREILNRAEAKKIKHFILPGAYELPLAAKMAAKSKRFDAIIVFGAIVKGETDHYEVILQTCIRELGRVMYDFEVPVIMEIIPVHNIKHLIERSQGEHNKGIEAAQAAIEIVHWRRGFRAGGKKIAKRTV